MPAADIFPPSNSAYADKSFDSLNIEINWLIDVVALEREIMTNKKIKPIIILILEFIFSDNNNGTKKQINAKKWNITAIEIIKK